METMQAEYRKQNYVVSNAVSCDRTDGEIPAGIFRSNEPFLNKPARYTELSKDNAVRRGKDQDMLFRLCDELPNIKSSKDAYDDLVYMLKRLIVLRDEKASLTVFSVPDSSNLPVKIASYCFEALKQNYEGEVLTLIVAGLYHLLFCTEDAKVEVHPVNESGASSKEISDLDIYIDDHLIVSNELKDKEYSESDVRHAADKVLQAGGNRMLFIEGPRGKATSNFSTSLIREYAEKNFMLVILPASAFISIICFLQALFGEKCKIFSENVASPNWRKLQSLDRQLFCQP